MKAAVYTNYGPPEVVHLSKIATPIPKDNEVLIKIHAATVNRTDCGFRSAELFIMRLFNGLTKPKKQVLGNEFAGVIAAMGKSAKLYKVGDAVFGLNCNGLGAHAEYLCLPETGAMTLKPSAASYDEAAAVCDGLMLAYNYLRQIDYSKGVKILIYGASGSIGTAAVQLAKHFGANVTAVCNTKNLEIVKSLGADTTIDYTKGDFTQSNERYDVVLDAVGKTSFFRCKRLLKPGGIFFSTDLGFLAQNPLLALLTALLGSIPGQEGKKVLFPLPNEKKEDVEFFKKLLESGAYKAVIDRRYPLDQIVEAYNYVETEEKTGNVVITMP